MITIYSPPYQSIKQIYLRVAVKEFFGWVIVFIVMLLLRKKLCLMGFDSRIITIVFLGVAIVYYIILQTMSHSLKNELRSCASVWAEYNGRLYFISPDFPCINGYMFKTVQNAGEIEDMISGQSTERRFSVQEITEIKNIKYKRKYSRVYFNKHKYTDISIDTFNYNMLMKILDDKNLHRR